MSNDTKKPEAAKPTDPKAAQGTTPNARKGVNDWTSADPDCPKDLVVNAGNKPFILGALAQCPNDSARIDVGDRRHGEYYVKLVNQYSALGHGLQFVNKLPVKRLADLEKIRAVRTGERAPDWVEEVWAKKGKEAPSRATTADELARLAAGRVD